MTPGTSCKKSGNIGLTYRLLLLLYPRSFRESYGHDLVRQLRNEREEGGSIRARWDLVISAFGVRLDSVLTRLSRKT